MRMILNGIYISVNNTSQQRLCMYKHYHRMEISWELKLLMNIAKTVTKIICDMTLWWKSSHKYGSTKISFTAMILFRVSISHQWPPQNTLSPTSQKAPHKCFFLGAFNSRKVLPFSQRYHAKWQVSFSWEQYCHENSVVFIRINATRKNMHKSFQHTTSIQLALCSHENTLYS
jgi:hypothetical protein